jgi:hypothetical protein
MQIGPALLAQRYRDLRRSGRHRHAYMAACVVFAGALALLLAALSGCALPALTAAGASARTPTATPLPTVAPSKGGDSPLPALSASIAHCADLPAFTGAQTASAGTAFVDLPFPPQSVSVAGAGADNFYHYQLVNVCVDGGGAASDTLKFYAGAMKTAGWAATPTYPYDGDQTHACGDTYCWRKADKVARYVSLEHLSGNGAVTIYDGRLATGPTPSASLAVRSAGGSGRPGQAVTVSASCSGGEQMVGGGYSVSTHAYGATSSYPSAQSTWTVTVVGAGSVTFAVQTYVECLSANYSLGLQLVPVSFQVAAGAGSQATTAGCTSGVAVGGGAKVSGSGAQLAESAPAQGLSGWNASATAGSGGAQGTAYALCATRNLDAGPPTSRTFTIYSGTDAQASLGCASGQWLTSGGYSNSDPGADGKNLYSLDGPTADGSRWFVQGRNLDSSSAHGATIWAVCVVPNPQF